MTSSVKQCYLTVEPHVVYKTNQLLPEVNKDVLSALQNSNVIYQFSCHCDSRYVGRTSQRLQDIIKQHVPKSIRYDTSSPKRDLPIRKCKYSTKSTTLIQSLTYDLTIGLHLLRNPTCVQHYDDSTFSILAKGRSPFHLSALEATFIKTSNFNLCRQKEFVYNLNILRTASLSHPLVLCQSQLGSFYKYSAFSVLFLCSDGFYMERAERSLQAPLKKCCKVAPSLKNAAKYPPPKNSTKQLLLKNAAKKAASKYAVNAALLKNAMKQLSRRCHVMSK